MSKVCRARVAGPLAAHAEAFRAELARLGYAPGSAEKQVLVMARVSRWLAGEGLDAGDLSAVGVQRMLAAWRAAAQPGVRVPTARALAVMLGYLREQGVLRAEPMVEADGPLDELLAGYRGYLAGDRGLAARTIDHREVMARRFLEGRMAVVGGRTGAEGLTGGEVTSFLLGECARMSAGSARSRVAELRSLLRFLHLTGVTAGCLTGSLPPVAGWRDTRLVATLSASEVAAILDSCQRSTAIGARDFAVLLVLARLGLRAAEVAGIQLGDVDWRAGELRVRGKGGRVDLLPLPHEVGEAIAGYLTGWRPQAGCRTLFVSCRAPLRALHPNTVSRIVRFACLRAGVAPVSAHRLRHALAAELLRQGSSLQDIGQVLRHRDLATTAVYAKVDRDALRGVAAPWPGATR